LLLYAAGIAVFFVAARYRLPLALLLIPLAVDQALHLLALGRGALKSVASLAALIVVLNLPNEFTRSFAADGAERGIVEAHAWRNQGKIGPADRLAEKLVARFPDHANVRMLKAELLVNSGRCEQARSHLQRVTELAPRAATPWVMLGSCLDQLDDHDAAERAYAMALALHPYHSRALKLVGAMYARRGRSFEAQAVFKRFLKSGYQDPDVDQWLKELTATERRP
jgi:tetratricopeptide (TPR) repeat protein